MATADTVAHRELKACVLDGRLVPGIKVVQEKFAEAIGWAAAAIRNRGMGAMANRREHTVTGRGVFWRGPTDEIHPGDSDEAKTS
ncbi:MAG: hypothetical protein HN904_13610 [Victivallales bacterium]|nr:hypothetical protein [Victivallales bacterium]